jgi:hypothetical protein
VSTTDSVQVYLSYCEQDYPWVRDNLIPRLHRAKIEIIEFKLGRPLVMEIQRAVEETKYILLVLSKEYIENSWGNFEFVLTTTASLHKNTWKGLPIKIKKCELPLLLRNLVGLDLIEQSDEKWELLLKTILEEEYVAREIDTADRLAKTTPSLGGLVMQLDSFQERAHTLNMNVRMSRPYLTRLRKYSIEIKQYLANLKKGPADNHSVAWNEFDTINMENVNQELERAETIITKGIRSNSTPQRRKYTSQVKKSIASIEESLRYLKNVLKGKL